MPIAIIKRIINLLLCIWIWNVLFLVSQRPQIINSKMMTEISFIPLPKNKQFNDRKIIFSMYKSKDHFFIKATCYCVE